MLYRVLIRPFLFLFDPESVHRFAFAALRFLMAIPGVAAPARRVLGSDDPRLRVRAFGIDFPNPIGLAAGFDKDAEGIGALGALGFGAIEVGTLTSRAQPGNDRPRLFRLPADSALVNRMGFNNAGVDDAVARLRRRRNTIVGVNIGKAKVTPLQEAPADYARCATAVAPFADYLAVNVSSPNTPGLRDLQSVESLETILVAVRGAADAACPARRVPLLVKIAPDLADEDIDDIGDLARRLGLDGIIATNTTIARTNLSTDVDAVARLGAGGLSGAPLRERSLEVLRRLRARVGSHIVLVAAGGIMDSRDAWDRIRAGASLVQVYTGFIYAGPAMVRGLCRGLSAELDRTGVTSITDAIGADEVDQA
ncbi:MAG: quinone-dependent dihydroorotate dehydrogenase [Deltaproteobacteria bacterium]|nr:quinone-dependent dihydroorotate dehydrogenase [Deltaproteobacteria bacterium]